MILISHSSDHKTGQYYINMDTGKGNVYHESENRDTSPNMYKQLLNTSSP